MPTPSPVCFGAWRLQLTAKQGRNFYKGNRVGSLGDWTKRGVYKIDYKKVRTYVVPKGLHNTDLTPFVSRSLPPKKPSYKEAKGTSGFDGLQYLKAWNRGDSFPTTAGKRAMLEARYHSAKMSIAPQLFSRNNPPPVGKVIIVEKKKVDKERRKRQRARRISWQKRKLVMKHRAKQRPMVL